MLKLACLNCGAPLEIGHELVQFACAFCGSQQRVERSGGVVALRRVESAIQAVQRGTDRTAAELAIPRLRAELANLHEQRKAAIKSVTEKVESARRGRGILTWTVFLLVFMLTPLLFAKVSTSLGAVVTLIWIVGSVAAPTFVFRKIKLPADNSAAVVAPIDQRIQRVEAHLAANVSILDELPV